MPWFKVDDGFHSHAKTITAGTAAIGLWARCGSWSAQHLTDGFVPANVARAFGTTVQIKSLVTSGLWSSVDGGYQFHDFTEYNPTSEAVRAEREAAKERQRRAREAARQKRDGDGSSGEVTDLSRRDTLVTSGEVRSPRPDPTHTEGSKEPSRRRKNATPPPDIYPINDEMRAWAEEHAPDVMLVVETAKMLDWARSGGHKKADWLATWRNWVRRRQEEINDRNAARPAQDDDEAWMR